VLQFLIASFFLVDSYLTDTHTHRMRVPTLAIKPNRSESLPWRLEGHRELGKRKRLFFKTKREAQITLEKIKAQKNNEGLEVLSTITRGDAITALKILAGRGTLTQAARHFAEWLDQNERTITLGDLIEELIQSKRKDGASHVYLQDLHYRLGNFARDFAPRPVASITGAEIDDWLRGLDLSPQSRTNYRRVLGLTFAYAVTRAYASTNPVDKTAKVKLKDAPPEVFTVANLQTL